MRRIANRRGKSGGAIVLGLFAVSCLLMVPALRWAFDPRDEQKPAEYIFATASKPSGDANRIDQQSQKPGRLSFENLTIKGWHFVPDMNVQLAQFESVFWEPNDTDSMRAWIRESTRVDDARILEIGTGTGIVSLACLLRGAASMVATDINPNAYANAIYNAEHLGQSVKMDVRLVSVESPGPFAVIRPDEKFDLILSNPPWENASVGEVAAHALYDPDFSLLDSLLSESSDYLSEGGSLLLAYGAKTAIQRIIDTAPDHGWELEIADDRRLEDLPEVFLPGMLLVLNRNQ